MDASEAKVFSAERAKNGRAACKKCKNKCEAGVLRMAKVVPNHFSDQGTMKQWYHVDCLFAAFKNQRATTRKIESVDDIDGWEALSETDRDEILEKLHESLGTAPKAKVVVSSVQLQKAAASKKATATTSSYVGSAGPSNIRKDTKDNRFRTFREICDRIAADSRYSVKSEILQKFLTTGTSGKKFQGDVYLWIKMLLPSAVRRIYNLQSKQLIKLFSRVFRTNHQEMLTDLEQGDVSETVRKYFEDSKSVQPNSPNDLTLQEVDEFLEELSQLTKEDDQVEAFQGLCEKCDADDLKMVIRLVKHDLRINAGPRHILDALDPSAYIAFQSSRNLKMVVDKFAPLISQNKISSAAATTSKPGECSASSTSGVQLMSPISPMLAEACKSVEKAIAKNPDGLYSEVKYDGERVQIHKKGNEFRFFSRNLKPVQDHKISRCKEFIPKAFPKGQDIILDSEIVMVDTKTGQLLPFGTLGKHKREQFADSEVCLFIFDCIYYNGEDLTKKSLFERKNILKKTMIPIKYHVELSEYYLIKSTKELALMTAKVLKAGLEGLVLKNVNSHYHPGKRGWMKLKKDYLFGGQMADTADLVVLGAWYGTGKKGGMLSIFLMGCLDKKTNLWKTVTKVHSGLDDATMEDIQPQLKPLMERADPDQLPKWIYCKRQSVPDFLAKNPLKMPVWEITGAEFSKAEAHTANGISIRFPRITRMRDDKDPHHATNLTELENLFKNSKDSVNVDMLFKGLGDVDEDEMELKTKFLDLSKGSDDALCSSDVEDKSKAFTSPAKKKKSPIESDAKVDVKRIKVEKEYRVSVKEREKPQCNPTDHVKMEVDVKKELLDLFGDIVAFILPEAENHCKPLLNMFLKRGGIVTQDSRSATHALHRHNQNTEDLPLLRQKYQQTCRHLTYKWIEDSIERGDQMPLLNYAVML